MMDARAERVRANVHAAWRSEVDRRKRERARAALTAFRWIAAAAVVGFVLARPVQIIDPFIARVERVDGPAPLEIGARIRAGDWIVIGRAARVALRAGGHGIRLDQSSRARFISHDVIELTAGAIYLETHDAYTPISIRTSAGTITHIGTRFEVRVLAQGVRVRVRSGMVVVRGDRDPIKVAADTEVMLTSSGAESRAIAAFDDEWNWTARVGIPLRFEGRPLRVFLADLAGENGWTVRYADAELERAASKVVLRGSIEGLDAEAALSVALTIADLSYTLDRGELRIWRSSSR